ncbi:type II toxin-antitoxin system HicA family toxin [Nostoc ellipsosporum NOK]|nr:type II toxin-antitoxin system HicA family toxin [Nostoc ellipsosporum NOK]
MGNFRPLRTKCWEKFLRSLGFSLSRISSSHHQWTKEGKRTITFWGNKPEVPAFHLKTCCSSIGCSMEILYQWAEKNC